MNNLDIIRSNFLSFYRQREHTVINSASLVPENDPTTLFVSSGMQPLLPYFLGQAYPQGKRICNSQKCFRAVDIEEIGDARHSTFFEMLGNWSFGDYFKKEQLWWISEFFIKELNLDPKKLYVSVYSGNQQLNIPKDNLSIKIWQEIFQHYGIQAKVGQRIFIYDDKKNWWSRSGTPDKMPTGEPGGGDSEIFYDFGEHLGLHQNSSWADEPCHPNCDCGRFIEIGNSVFMEYQKQQNSFIKLPHFNVDYGGGLERALMAVENQADLFQTSLFTPIITQLEKLSEQQYQSADNDTKRCMRIIADHLRSSVMLIVDGVLPNNKEQGYLLRRLIRRSVVMSRELHFSPLLLAQLTPTITQIYENAYPEIKKQRTTITQALQAEINRFQTTLEKGLKKINSLVKLDGETAFFLYESYGFPIELTKEIATKKGLQVNYQEFLAAKKKHQEISRGGLVKKFKSGLADHQDLTVKYHTATHLLLAALRKHLDKTINQRGSNISSERARFDFNFSRPLSEEECNTISEQINTWIKDGLAVSSKNYPKAEALERVGGSSFADRYPDEVSVYCIEKVGEEICTGPHVKNTHDIPLVKIYKQATAGAGVRRIYLQFLSLTD